MTSLSVVKTTAVFLILITVSTICLSIGPVHIPIGTTLMLLTGRDVPAGLTDQESATYATILWRIRFPRVVLGIIVGMALAIAGCVFQGILRNPLADPYILGVSSGAALGAAAAIVAGLSGLFLGQICIPLCAFGGALVSMFLVYSIARVGPTLPPNRLLLSGIIVNAFLSALIMLIMSLSQMELNEIINILLGNLGYIFTEKTLILFIIVCIFILAGTIVIFTYGRTLNLLSFGEESAAVLGVDVEKTKKILFVILSLMVGSVVSLSGLIGFVGLITPHMTRIITGPDHRILMPLSAMNGAILLVITDTIARSIGPVELPVGVITALLGGPFFLFLLTRHRKGTA
jgi:iron complex transport system permease protein